MSAKSPAVVTVAEPIGRGWRNELLWLDAAGLTHPEVRDGQGNLLPCQLANRSGKESAQIAVLVNLEPDAVLQLHLESGSPHPDANPFAVTQGADAIVIDNGMIAVRLPVSASHDAGWVPGPIVGIRRADDLTWSGAGIWGPVPAASKVETRIIDRGPLFARWITRYTVGGRELARYDVRLLAGEDFVRVRESSEYDTGAAFRFALEGNSAPSHWFVYGGGEAVDVFRGPIGEPPDAKGRQRPGELVHLDFCSGHNQMSYTWAGFYAAQGPALAVTELHGGGWQLPGRNRIVVRYTEGGIAFDFAANGGSREYALCCGDVAAYAPAEGLSRLCHIRRKHSDLPLDKVRHWVTNWELPAREQPLLYPQNTALDWREKLEAWPELAEAYRDNAAHILETQHPSGMLPAYLATGDKRLLESLLAAIERGLDEALAHALDNGYLRLIIFDGRGAKVWLEAIDILRATGELNAATQRRFARKLAFLSYCFADPDFWPMDSMFRARGDARSLGDDYWDDIGDIICPPNFTTEYYTSFGLAGLAYPEHPAAESWIASCEELFERNLQHSFYESGGYCESANYHDHNAIMMLQVAIALLAANRIDFFEDARFKANFAFFIDMLTPPLAMTPVSAELADAWTNLNPPRDAKAVLATNWGNTSHDCGCTPLTPTMAVAAGIYTDRDPLFARRLMTVWRNGPQKFLTHYSGFNLVALGRPGLEDIAVNLDSALVEGLGAVMRAGQGTDREIFAWIKAGVATHHNCRDEGGIVLYANGAPLLGDFGYHCVHNGKTEGGYETWKHNCISFGGRTTNGYMGMEQVLPPELWRSGADADLLVSYLPNLSIIPPNESYLSAVEVPRIEHRRAILFVKPHYFVVYDHIYSTPLKPYYWLHALADEVEIREGGARFIGRFGSDVDLQVLVPNEAVIVPGDYSVQKHVSIERSGAGDYLTVITPLLAGEPAPNASYDETSRTLRVTGEWGADEIRLVAEDDYERVISRPPLQLSRAGREIAL